MLINPRARESAVDREIVRGVDSRDFHETNNVPIVEQNIPIVSEFAISFSPYETYGNAGKVAVHFWFYFKAEPGRRLVAEGVAFLDIGAEEGNPGIVINPLIF